MRLARRRAAAFAAGIVAALVFASAGTAKAETCEPHAAGAFTPEGGNAVAALPAFCRVRLVLRPSADSEIRSEVWLPEAWNGRLQMVGNGGWAGVINYAAMGEALRQGYAAVATDTGHQGNRATFALGHPEKLTDFGWRAVHETVVAARTVIADHYGRPAAFAYWNSCSTGGRQGLMEAQRFPDDFDGVVAGAPAIDMFRLHAAWMWDFTVGQRAPGAAVPATKFAVVQRAAIAACDETDGVADGLIGDPLTCRFDPGVLACADADGSECLTPAQVETVRRIYRGMSPGDGGPPIYPGPEPGSEFGWAFHSGETEPARPARDTFAYAVYGDADWDPASFDVAAALERAKTADGGRVAATQTDLTPFFSHGGKLLLYHGWEDPNIPPRTTIAYRDAVAEGLGGEAEADRVMRLYLLPGMGHCGGGYGPNRFDAMAAIRAWVEEGRAPEALTARQEADGRVVRTRPICPYPAVARYRGTGDPNDARSFQCAAPPVRTPAS